MANLSATTRDTLAATVEKMTADARGVLAADESTGTMGKRLATVQLDNTEDYRRAWRELMFSASGIEKYICGVILYEETLFQNGSDGSSLIDKLSKVDVLIGIKVDIGLTPLPGSPDESTTQGLDNLRARCKKYFDRGARFAKWRSVFDIDVAGGKPSPLAIDANCDALAAYASICQECGLVPIVEPEILSAGAHSIEDCAAITEKLVLLKPNMVLAGNDHTKADAKQVASLTLRALSRTVPPAVPGIFFLSGGQNEEDSTTHLALINQQKGEFRAPWKLSFSYGRALQASAIKFWAGSGGNTAKAQGKFLERAQANSLAGVGKER